MTEKVDFSAVRDTVSSFWAEHTVVEGESWQKAYDEAGERFDKMLEDYKSEIFAEVGLKPKQAILLIDNPKMVREMLCVAQSAINLQPHIWGKYKSRAARLQNLIDQIDVQRPIGPDGRHGDLHTYYCGCDV